MVLSTRSKLGVLFVTAAGVLSGCGTPDYTNNWDTSSYRTGNASAANTSIQELQTWPPMAYKSTVGSGG
jgi:hypothetical protein